MLKLDKSHESLARNFIGKKPSKETLFLDIVKDIQNASNIQALLETGVKNAFRIGFTKMSYHLLPPCGNFYGQLLSNYFSYNIPEKILRHYDNVYSKKFDPLIQYVTETGTPVWLSEAIESPYFKTTQHDIIMQQFLVLLGNGLAIPLYGPRLKPGYIYLGARDMCEAPDELTKWIATSIASIFHTRYCKLTNDMAQKINLTLREMEVLDALIMGKTNPEIALMLNISKHTVNGYTKNLFMKFGTTDRVSTVMKALTHDVQI